MNRAKQLSVFLCIAFLLLGCSKEKGGGPNLAPDTYIVAGPDPGSTQSYRVALAWGGSDPDGEVVAFDIGWSDGTDSTAYRDSLFTWQTTQATSDTFELLADSCCSDGSRYHSYTFFVRAIDNDGAEDPSPAFLSFTAVTSAPRSRITYPAIQSGQRDVFLSTCVTVRWEGSDPDGEVVAYRYARKLYYDWPEGEPPPDWDTRWSDWMEATEVTIRLERLGEDNPWSFYVQAKDNAGAVETTFEDARNHIRIFIDPAKVNLPWIRICCYQGPAGSSGEVIGCRSTSGDTTQMDIPINVAIGDTIHFGVEFAPGQYATRVTALQFQLNDPDIPVTWLDASRQENWVYPHGDPFIVTQPVINTIYVWVKDDYCENGSTRRAHIKIQGVSHGSGSD